MEGLNHKGILFRWVTGRAKQLGLSYLYDHERFHFEDGISYLHTEAVYLAREKDDDIVAIHAVKKAFGGTLYPSEAESGQQ